jgi:hypothetical protein
VPFCQQGGGLRPLNEGRPIVPIQKVEVSITTTSVGRPWEGGPPIATPKITLNGNPLPAPKSPAYTPTGMHLVVLDAHKDMTNPESILRNEYVLITQSKHDWRSTYAADWTKVVRDILLSGDVNAQIVFLATYGIDANMFPTNEAVQILFELGGGAKLQHWGNNSIPGKQSDDPGTYVEKPANYVLIGYSSYKYGQGYEAYDGPGGQGPVTTSLTATLSNIVPG